MTEEEHLKEKNDTPKNLRMMAPLVTQGIIVFLISLSVITYFVLQKPLRAPEYDEFVYIRLASDLLTKRCFTNAGFGGDRAKEAERHLTSCDSGRFFMPLYPLFLAGIAHLDQGVKEAILCFGKTKKFTKNESADCRKEGGFATLVAVQILLAAATVVFVFLLSYYLSGSYIVGWLASAIQLGIGEYDYLVNHYLTENLSFFFFYAFLLFLVVAHLKNNKVAIFFAGVSIALATLSRPSYLYLIFFLPILLFLVSWSFQRSRLLTATWFVLLFLLGALTTLMPWAVRNHALFGDLALTKGYGSYILIQRLAYNEMSWAEWVTSFFFWLPDFGDVMTKALFPAHLWEKLPFYNNEIETYYRLGNSLAWRERLLAGYEGTDELSYLVKNHVFGDFFKHMMVTIPLTLRGIWVGKYVSLLAMVLLFFVWHSMRRAGKGAPFLLLLMPLFFMAGLHGFVSVNVMRYNIPISAAYSFIVSYFLIDILSSYFKKNELSRKFTRWTDG